MLSISTSICNTELHRITSRKQDINYYVYTHISKISHKMRSPKTLTLDFAVSFEVFSKLYETCMSSAKRIPSISGKMLGKRLGVVHYYVNKF